MRVNQGFKGAGARALVWAVMAMGATASVLAAEPAAVSASASAPLAPPPVEAFARLPLLSRVALSPNGNTFAALMNRDDTTLLVTQPVTGGKLRGVLSTDNKEFRIRWVRWVNDERLVVSVVFPSRRDFVATSETRLLSVKADGSGLVNLVRNAPSAGSVTGYVRSQQIQDTVVDWMPGDGKHILLALSEADRVLPGVYKVNVETGERRMVRAPERDVYHWVTDAQHRVRVGVREKGEGTEVLVSDADGKNWRTLWSAAEGGTGTVSPMGFGLDPNELYVRARHDGRWAVFSVRLDDPALPRTLRLSHPTRDVEGELLRSPRTGEVLGLRSAVNGADGGDAADGESRSELWDTTWRPQARAIDLALPERDNSLVDISRDEQRYLVHSDGNGKPGLFYLGDRRTGDLFEIGSQYPELDPARLSGKHVTTIKARDGLPLNAFLSLPAGRRAGDGGAALPMVLLPHGGPHSRDDDGFDVWTEFLASRGYAVLQVNFRGSDGYGIDFKNAGLRRWGLEMQDDLTDAVQWAVAQKVADARRVCIVGGSYGGYAALMGAVKTPELYRCAISFAGVSDLPDLMQHWSDYVLGRETAEHMLGRAWGDRERLRATSPARQAERIRVPVLLAHGTADRVVPVDQSETMASALKSAGKRYRYLALDQGDHHLSRYTHRLEFFKAMEAFLGEHLAPASGS
jgi:dipeptidyl aminopeptidase/acylaminoacyl peptidase